MDPIAPMTRDQRGIVLVLVLWSIALLALIGARLTSASRTDIATATDLYNATRAEAAADGAVHEAIARLADGGALHWSADRLIRTTSIGGVQADVSIENLAGRLNPNSAPAELMAALLVRLGMPTERALAQGGALFDWRMPGGLSVTGGTKRQMYRMAGFGYVPPSQPYENDNEIAAVVGMTPEVSAALRPYLSIHNDGAVDPNEAAVPLRLALQDLGINQLANTTPSATVEITALARSATGNRFLRRAVVRFRPGEPYQILAWSQSE